MTLVPITILNKSGVLEIRPQSSVLSSLYDNKSHAFDFSRPSEYEDSNMGLLFEDKNQIKRTYALGKNNSFSIPNELTQTTDLSLQVVMKKTGESEYSNIIKFKLRPSLLDFACAGDDATGGALPEWEEEGGGE